MTPNALLSVITQVLLNVSNARMDSLLPMMDKAVNQIVQSKIVSIVSKVMLKIIQIIVQCAMMDSLLILT